MRYVVASTGILAAAYIGFTAHDATRQILHGPIPSVIFVAVSALLLFAYRRIARIQAHALFHTAAGLAAVVVGSIVFLFVVLLFDPSTYQHGWRAIGMLFSCLPMALFGCVITCVVSMPLGIVAGWTLWWAISADDKARIRADA